MLTNPLRPTSWWLFVWPKPPVRVSTFPRFSGRERMPIPGSCPFFPTNDGLPGRCWMKKRPGFDLGKIQRFVLDRVVELGWTEERFGQFDDLMYGAFDHSRSEHKTERIGKKYQWIAYHEMLAYIADHFQFCQEYGAGGPYEGPWQIGLRDIDPSAPVELFSGREKDSPRPAGAWWSPASFDSWDAGGSIENWVADASDVPALDSGLVVQDPGEPGALWICCYGFQLFREQLPGEQASLGTHRREFWLRRMAFLVPEGTSDRFIEWVMSEEFRDSHWPISVPQLDTYGVFLGEHCWSPASAEQVAEQEAEPLEWRFPADADPVRALIPVLTHSGSGNGYDCSVGPESIELCLPSRAVVEGCGISWSGQMADFVDGGSRLVAYDPSARELGPWGNVDSVRRARGIPFRSSPRALLDRCRREDDDRHHRAALWLARTAGRLCLSGR